LSSSKRALDDVFVAVPAAVAVPLCIPGPWLQPGDEAANR